MSDTTVNEQDPVNNIATDLMGPLPDVMEEAQSSIRIGDVDAARDALYDTIKYRETNREELTLVSKFGDDPKSSPLEKNMAARAQGLLDGGFGVDSEAVLEEEANMAAPALVRGAGLAKTGIGTIRAVHAYHNRKTNPFLTPIIRDALTYANGRAKEQGVVGPVALDGAPTNQIQDALSWQDTLTKSEQFSSLMQNLDYQRAASSALSVGFMMGGEDRTTQSDFTMHVLESASRLSEDKSAAGQAKFVSGLVKGLTFAMQRRTGKDKREIPGFIDKTGLSADAIHMLLDKTVEVFEGGGYAAPNLAGGFLQAAAEQYSSYIDADLANVNHPSSYAVLAEVAVAQTATRLGKHHPPLSDKAQNYFTFTTGVAKAVTGLKRGDASGFFEQAQGARSVVTQVSPIIARLSLDDNEEALRDDLKASGTSWGAFVTLASDATEGHKTLSELEVDGRRVISDEQLVEFKVAIDLGLNGASRDLAGQSALFDYDSASTMVRADYYKVDIGAPQKIDVLDDTVDKIERLLSNGTPEAISLGARRLLTNFDAATEGVVSPTKVKALRQTINTIATQATYMEGFGEVSEKQAEAFERTVVGDKKAIEGDVALTARLETIAKDYQEAVDLKMDNKAEDLLLNYVATIDNVGYPFTETKPSASPFDILPVSKHPMVALYRQGRAAAGRTKSIKNIANSVKAGGGVLSVDTVLSAIAPYRMEDASPKWFIPFDNASSGRKELGDLGGALQEQLATLQSVVGGLKQNAVDTRSSLMADVHGAGMNMKQVSEVHGEMETWRNGRTRDQAKAETLTLLDNSVEQLMNKGAQYDTSTMAKFAEIQKMRLSLQSAKDISRIWEMSTALSTILYQIEGEKKGVTRVTEKQRLITESRNNSDLAKEVLRPVGKGGMPLAPTEEDETMDTEAN